MRTPFLASGLVAAAALLLWLTLRGGDAGAPAPRAPTGTAAAPDVPSTPGTGGEVAVTANGAARAEVPLPPPAPAFTCVDDDGNVIPDAVRDGVVIRVLGPDRLAFAGAALDVRWRKGWGQYGNDRGITDARGELTTTVSHHEMLEGITLQHPTLGALETFSGFLPAFAEPRVIVCVVPALEPLVVRLLDERGRPVAGGTIECDVDREPVALREHPLLHDPGELVTDRDGRVRLSVRAGEVVLRAKAERHVSLYQLTATVPVGGCTLTTHVLSPDALHPVRVTLTPAGLSGLRVRAVARELPPLPHLAPSGVEPLQQDYPVRWPARREPVVDAPPTTWSCHVSADRCEGTSVVVAPSTTEVDVTLRRRAPTPVARLRCRLLDPDGLEVHGEVMVHTEPNLVHGSRHQVSPRDPWVELPPGGTAVVSGWRYQAPPAFAGPLVLTAGEHEVVLRFARPNVIRGRVVDERGEPVKASVALYRPAGLLQRLGTNVPAILDGFASGDTRTTGDDGGFRFEHVGDGDHALAAHPKGNGWPARLTVTAGDENVVLRLGENIGHLARVQGRVTRAGTGEGVAARVAWRAGDGVHGRFTDADGRYTIALPPGRWRPEVKSPRHAYLLGEPTGLVAGVTTTCDLVVTPSEPLFVVVRDAAGRVPDVAIEAFDARGLPIVLLDAFANDDGDARPGRNGRAELRGLPDGELRLRLTDANDERAIQDVVVPAGTRRDVELAISWVPQRRPLPAEAK